jgi:RNA-directed DNA polymerase
MDRDCAKRNIIPRESGQTSIWSLITREFVKPSQEGKQMAVMKQIAITVDLNTQKPDTATSLTGASSHTGDEWHDINWRKVHQNVRRLQARIVKATQEVVYMLRNRV